MKKLTGSIVALLALAVSQFLTVTANAASLQIFLDQSNESSVFASGTNYLTVTISDRADGAINFMVQTNDALSSIADSNYGIQAFSFNFGDSGASAENLVLPSDWEVSNGAGSHSVFGKFDVTLKGTGSNRLDPLEFSIDGVSGDSPADYIKKLSSGDALFAAHVAGFEMSSTDQGSLGKNLTSAQFGGSSVVPIPAAVWLMFSALAVLGWRGKKSVASKAGGEETEEPTAA
jgi:hypothetical protein